MSQEEINTKAMANIFAIEDSKDLFEAIGDLNDDPMMGGQAEPEHGVDDMLTVIPGSTDPFAGQSITSQAQQEPSDEDKMFVIDRFAELMANDHKNVVTPNEIDVYSPIIQKEVGFRVPVQQFLTDVETVANQRLSAQNVSEAQPTGAATNEIAPQSAAAPEAPVDPTAMGTPAMEPAPGGIAPEPSLDANVGDVPPAGDDLGLGAISDDAGLGDFGAEEPAAPAGDDLGLGAISDDAGLGDLGGEEPAADAGSAIDDELGSIGDEGDAAAAPAEGGEDTGTAGSEGDALGGENNLDSISDEDFGSEEDTGDAGSDEGKSDAGSDEDEGEDPEFEAEMAHDAALLESIRSKYVESKARREIRAMVEGYMQKKKAKLESADKTDEAEEKKEEPNEAPAVEECGDKPAVECGEKPMEECNAQATGAEAATADESMVESVAATKRDELAKKVAPFFEGEAVLENAAKAFAAAKDRKEKAKTDALNAKLESISSNYHKVIAKEQAAAEEKRRADALNAKLEAIAAKANPKKTLAESATKTAPKKDSSLNEQLKHIIDSVK